MSEDIWLWETEPPTEREQRLLQLLKFHCYHVDGDSKIHRPPDVAAVLRASGTILFDGEEQES